jgi:hypothetical protein
MSECFHIALTAFPASVNCCKIIISYAGEFIPSASSLPFCPVDVPPPGMATG